MPQRQTPLAQLKSVLKSRAEAARKAETITRLAARLPEAALPLLDEALEGADPLVQVALMDAHFEMTGDDYHEDDLIRIMDNARRAKVGGEELYMAARIALGRINGKSRDALDEWGDAGLEVAAFARRKRGRPRRGVRRLAAAAPSAREEITVIIHGTWASDESWWRPRGDFFEYVKHDLGRGDVYGGADQFRWSGKNRDSSRQKASDSLAGWIKKHPAAEINVFAHSHGANVAMLATHDGVRIDRLVMLSPPVRRDYFAKWSNVGKAFNIQASWDPVVAIARGGKWFRGHGVREKVLKASGHSSSHESAVWRKERLGAFVGIPW